MFQIVDTDGFKDLKYFGSDILANQEVYTLEGDISIAPTRTSIQIGSFQHIEDDLGQYINHSCDPSVKIVKNKLIAVKDIHDSDSITFDYNDSEEYMSNPFTCHCCGKLIAGKLK